MAKYTLFCPAAPDRKAAKLRAHNLNIDFNRLYENQADERSAILHDLLGSIGKGTFIQGPITMHYGVHTFVGDNTFINFNFTCQDDANVYIGNHCDIGPNMTIVTPCHPMLPDERISLMCEDGVGRRLCYAKEVHIGNGCWFGANVVVCPGVTIGDGCVIGAGSVVTRDVPPLSFAAGNPCRVIRPITEEDSIKDFELIP